jgi:hypothetical protein
MVNMWLISLLDIFLLMTACSCACLGEVLHGRDRDARRASALPARASHTPLENNRILLEISLARFGIPSDSESILTTLLILLSKRASVQHVRACWLHIQPP